MLEGTMFPVEDAFFYVLSFLLISGHVFQKIMPECLKCDWCLLIKMMQCLQLFLIRHLVQAVVSSLCWHFDIDFE